MSLDILAYRLLKSASLTEQQKQLARATINTLVYDAMKTQLKKIFADSPEVGEGTTSSDMLIKLHMLKMARWKNLTMMSPKHTLVVITHKEFVGVAVVEDHRRSLLNLIFIFYVRGNCYSTIWGYSNCIPKLKNTTTTVWPSFVSSFTLLQIFLSLAVCQDNSLTIVLQKQFC